MLCRLCDPVSDDCHLAFLTFVGIHALLAEPRNGIELPSCSRLCPQASALLQQLKHFEGGGEPRGLVAKAPGRPRSLGEGRKLCWGLHAVIEDIDASGYGSRHSAAC